MNQPQIAPAPAPADFRHRLPVAADCPFCGQPAEPVETMTYCEGGWLVECKTDECPGNLFADIQTTHCFCSKEAAIEAWNRRAK